jgi:hypothetical protein
VVLQKYDLMFNVVLTVHHSISACRNQREVVLFSLLRIKGLYVFRALLAHLQVALHKRHLVYCVCVMSVGCTRIEVGRSILNTVCKAPPEDEHIMLENMYRPLIINQLNKKCITLVSLY